MCHLGINFTNKYFDTNGKKRIKFFLSYDEETALIADISKLKKLGWKTKYKNTFSGIF
jgi:hypothetical protein